MAKEFKRYLVTSALPYANGPVHIGHLAGVYIPSDIYRYMMVGYKLENTLAYTDIFCSPSRKSLRG